MRAICHNVANIYLTASTPTVSLGFGMGKIYLKDDVLSIYKNVDVSDNVIMIPIALRKRLEIYAFSKRFVINCRTTFKKALFETLISF